MTICRFANHTFTWDWTPRRRLPTYGIASLRGLLLTSLACCLQSSVFGQVSESSDRNEAGDVKHFRAVVLEDAAPIHSGPADTLYPTDQLAAGAIVNVYRRDPDGWLAIQPPEGSFSLVPKSAVKTFDSSGVAEITEEGVRAWVGTKLTSPNTPLWQVILRKGERVVILGEQASRLDERGTITWMRISPPAGEFRWIHSSRVESLEPNHVALLDAAPVTDREGERGTPAGSEPRQADGFVARGEPSSGITEAADGEQDELLKPYEIDAELDFATEIRRLEMLLTELVQLPAEQWDTRIARRMAVTLEQHASSGAERYRINRLQDKLQSFEELRISRMAMAQLAAENSATGMRRGVDESPTVAVETGDFQLLSAVQAADGGIGQTISDATRLLTQSDEAVAGLVGLDDSPFVQTGILNRLVTNRGVGAGGYALQDSDGRIVAIISPSPGVNLERYLLKEIGVQGKSVPHPTYEVPMIVADRAALLSRFR